MGLSDVVAAPPHQGLRRPVRARRLAGGAPAVLLPAGAVAIAAGAFIPLLGIPLLAFLVVDVVMGRVKASG
nr:hypothetical protein GCM10020093_007760 [Planobispora longispora]